MSWVMDKCNYRTSARMSPRRESQGSMPNDSPELQRGLYISQPRKIPSSPTGGLPNHAKAVILGGEASSEAMRCMCDMLQPVFANLGKERAVRFT